MNLVWLAQIRNKPRKRRNYSNTSMILPRDIPPLTKRIFERGFLKNSLSKSRTASLAFPSTGLARTNISKLSGLFWITLFCFEDGWTLTFKYIRLSSVGAVGFEPTTLAPMAPRSNPLYLLGCLSGTSSPHVILFLSLFYQHLTVLEILPRALPSTVFHFVSKLFHRCYAPPDDFQGQSYYPCNTYLSFHSV